MTDLFPSPLPGPAWQAYRTAWTHVLTRTLTGVPEDVQATVLRTPAVLARHDRLCTRAAAGDTPGVQQQAQQWQAKIEKELPLCP